MVARAVAVAVSRCCCDYRICAKRVECNHATCDCDCATIDARCSESSLQTSSTAAARAEELAKRNELLLELLGEKEEELEDVRETYQIQLDELMKRLTAA
jgi:hypothetical protein